MRGKKLDGKWYFKLTYKKIMDDLPILGIKERQIGNIITKLEKLGILNSLSELKWEMYLEVDFDVLFGNKLPTDFDLSAIGFKFIRKDIQEPLTGKTMISNSTRLKEE